MSANQTVAEISQMNFLGIIWWNKRGHTACKNTWPSIISPEQITGNQVRVWRYKNYKQSAKWSPMKAVVMNNKAAFHINSGNYMIRLCMLSGYSLRKVCTVPESIFDESLLWFL